MAALTSGRRGRKSWKCPQEFGSVRRTSPLAMWRGRRKCIKPPRLTVQRLKFWAHTRSLGAAGTGCPMKPLWSWCSVWVVSRFSFIGTGGSHWYQVTVPATELTREVGRRYFKAKVDSHSQSKRGCQGNNVAPCDCSLLCTWSAVLMHCPHLLCPGWLSLLLWKQAAAFQAAPPVGKGCQGTAFSPVCVTLQSLECLLPFLFTLHFWSWF